MKSFKTVALALILTSAGAFADDFPPFFPQSGSTNGTAAQQQEGNVYATGNGLYVNESNTVVQSQPKPQQIPQPQQIQGIDPQILGSWELTNGSESLIFTMENSGIIKLTLNGKTKATYYRAFNGNLVLYGDQALQSVQKVIPYTVSGNSLILVIDNTQTVFQKKFAGGPTPAPGPIPAPGPVPAPGPMPAPGPVPAPGPMPAPGNQLAGSYNCQIQGNPSIRIRHEFTGNSYRVFMNHPATGQEVLIEIGSFTVSGNNFSFQVLDSPDPNQKGATGVNQIYFNAGGYDMRNPSVTMSCRR